MYDIYITVRYMISYKVEQNGVVRDPSVIQYLTITLSMNSMDMSIGNSPIHLSK